MASKPDCRRFSIALSRRSAIAGSNRGHNLNVALPWLRIIDAALGVTDLVRARRPRVDAPLEEGGQRLPAGIGGLETRLAGVVVAALKEAFDRDTRRLELEREQLDAERRRAEQALRLELLRQAGDREIGRLRLIAAVAVASWIGTLFFSPRLIGGPMSVRLVLGGGWLLLLLAMALAFMGQSAVAQALERAALDPPGGGPPSVNTGILAPWLIVAGLALVGVSVLIA